MRIALASVAVVSLGIGLFACNDHVFQVVQAECPKVTKVDAEIQTETDADILIVVDNSGSMAEEQAELVKNFVGPVCGNGETPDNNECCPINIEAGFDEKYLNPVRADYVEGELRYCGFVQLLAAYENKFHLGVITTDVSQCDNRFGAAINDSAGDPWGRKPQRGCLQPPTGLERKFLDWEDDSLDTQFAGILDRIQTYGSGYERGLDAVRYFVTEDNVHPSCEGDFESFHRPNAKFVMIFLTDEEDCSHNDGQNLLDQNGNPMTGENGWNGSAFLSSTCPNDGSQDNYSQTMPPAACYPPVIQGFDGQKAETQAEISQFNNLVPVSEYVNIIKGIKPDKEQLVQAAVIAGATIDDDGNVEPTEGCQQSVDDNSPPIGNCQQALGASNSTNECPVDANCCIADPGTRYFQFADGFDRRAKDSICRRSYRRTMLDLAAFIAKQDTIRLNEKPANPAAIVVRIIRSGGATEVIARIPDDDDPEGKDGWQYDGDKNINFFGSAVANPGDKIDVSLAASDVDAGCQ